MSGKLSLTEEGEAALTGLMRKLDLREIQKKNPLDPRINPDYRNYLLTIWGSTEEEIEEEWPSAAEG